MLNAKKYLSFRTIALSLLLPLFAATLHAQEKDITGTWQGTMQAG